MVCSVRELGREEIRVPARPAPEDREGPLSPRVTGPVSPASGPDVDAGPGSEPIAREPQGGSVLDRFTGVLFVVGGLALAGLPPKSTPTCGFSWMLPKRASR
jgi:hypothetical protein